MTEGQPIETAPKDGSCIRLWSADPLGAYGKAGRAMIHCALCQSSGLEPMLTLPQVLTTTEGDDHGMARHLAEAS